MTHPYIDWRAGSRHAVRPTEIKEMICEVGEGTVHRLWEPLADKQRPPNGYAAKFSQPYCIATAFMHRNVGLDAFTDTAVKRSARARARRQRALRDRSNNPYPNAFTGHIRMASMTVA